MFVIRLLKTVSAAVFLTVTLLSGTAMAVDISVTDDSMVPNPAMAVVGEPITFTNDTGETLRLIDSDERWDSGELAPDATFQITFNEAGMFEFASQDGSVTGAVEVREVGATSEADAEVEADTEADAETEIAADADADTAVAATGPAETSPTTLAETGMSSALLAGAGFVAFALGLVLLRRTREV